MIRLCNSLQDYANGGSWNEFNFRKVSAVADALAEDGRAIRCERGWGYFGKEVYGYHRLDSGTGQSIIPCPGSLRTIPGDRFCRSIG